MFPFYVIFILIATCAMLETFPVLGQQRKAILLILGVVLTLFAGLRYQPLAGDFQNYTEALIELHKKGLTARSHYDSSARIFEPGFNLLLWLSGTLFGPRAWMGFLVIAAIAVGLNLSCYKRYSNSYFLFAVLFYFTHTYLLRDMSLIRSGLGAALALYSVRYVEREQFWRFVGTLVFASTFHLATLVFLLVYPVYKLRWSARTWGWIVLGCFVVGTIAPLGKLLMALPTGGIFRRIAAYAWMIGDSSRGILTNPTILKQLFFVGLSLWFYNTLAARISHFRALLVPYAISVCWLMVWNDFPIIAGRLATFFSVTEVIVLPSVALSLITPRSRPLMGAVLVLLAFAILYMNGNLYLSGVEGLWPYRLAPIN